MLMNTAETRLPVMVLIARYLSGCEDNRNTRATVVDVISPAGLRGDAGNAEGVRKQRKSVNDSLDGAIQLGVVIESKEEEIRLADDATAAITEEGDRGFARYVRVRVLHEPSGKGKVNWDWEDQTGAKDLVRSLAWFLALPVSKAPRSFDGREDPTLITLQGEDFGERFENDAGDSQWPINNDSRWQSFRRWACSLGFAWWSPGGRLIPDPTTAIRDAVPEIFDSNGRLTAKEFVESLGRSLPVLDGGKYRKYIEEKRSGENPDPNQLSEATSDALNRLVLEKTLLMPNEDDSPDSIVRHFSDGRPFTHVSPPEKKKKKKK